MTVSKDTPLPFFEQRGANDSTIHHLHRGSDDVCRANAPLTCAGLPHVATCHRFLRSRPGRHNGPCGYEVSLAHIATTGSALPESGEVVRTVGFGFERICFGVDGRVASTPPCAQFIHRCDCPVPLNGALETAALGNLRPETSRPKTSA